ncbi:MAG: metalloregulator ArsR/SmtB family transcription factor [Proteobacteria bacterium]|nr:metalloregulator ArsR/SmtB family transcription factor [Pseudomonadota bacterium]
MDACCPPVCCEPLNEVEALEMATKLKALADPTRLRLFSLVASQEQQCACDLTEPLNVSQPTVSHHLKVLTDAGLLTREQRGKWAYFSASAEALEDLTRFLDPSALVSQR